MSKSANMEEQYVEQAARCSVFSHSLADLGIGRFEVRSMFCKPFAQLCVHGTVLRFIESLFENLGRKIGGEK